MRAGHVLLLSLSRAVHYGEDAAKKYDRRAFVPLRAQAGVDWIYCQGVSGWKKITLKERKRKNGTQNR